MKSKVNTVKRSKIISSKTLIERITEKKRGMLNPINTKKSEVDKIVRRFLNEVNKSLIAGEEIRLVGHFTLRTDIRASKVAFNFMTKKKQTLPEMRVPKIKFSTGLKKQIANKK